MKTPRRRFLSVLGGALLSRAVRAEDDLFSGTPAPDDPLELLYSRRLSFSGGEPLITVRVLEGRQQIVFVPKGPLTARVRSRSGEMTTAVAGGASGRWTLQLLESSQGAGASWVELEQLRYDDKQGLQKAREDWAAKRVAIRIATVGEAYGIAGHVVDTRKYSVLADGDGTEAAAQQKAQAVTARGEVLAKIGARHLGDPYLLCAEQHCQVYKGVAAEQAGPDAAVEATRGEALFAEHGGQSRLVDSVYSAVCGGFTEDNDAVWSGPADPSLRGRPDFDPLAPGMGPFRDGVGEALVSRFVHLDPVPSYCAASGFANADKVRWRRTFTQREVDEICASLGVGTVQTLAVEGRGVSGRARALRIAGSRASARVYGELQIRRLFRNLNSGMFVVERSGSGWIFVGGGWGHGSGMCQTGAIGRAQRGATYRDILAWYYSGAAPVRIY